jgi:MFS family permease
VFGITRALEEALPALQTTVTVTIGVCAFVSLLAAGVVAAWSIAFYFWLHETMSAPQSAFLAGVALLVLCAIAVFAGRLAIRSAVKPEKPPKRDKHDALASAIEAMGDMAEARPVPAILSALALGLAAGFFDDDSD